MADVTANQMPQDTPGSAQTVTAMRTDLEVQAVHWFKQDRRQIVFWTPETVAFGDGISISCDVPAILQFRNTTAGPGLAVTDPYH